MARASLTPWVTQEPWTSLIPNLIFLVHGTPSYSAKHIPLHIDFGLI